MATVNLSNFSADQLVYGAAKLNRRGGITVPLGIKTAKGTEPILVQTPKLRAPFGVSCFDETAEDARYTISVSLDDFAPNGNAHEFYEFLKAFDESNVETARSHSADWFKGKQHSKDLLQELYKPMCIPPKPGSEYAPMFRGKLRSFKNDIKTLCFDENKELVDMREAVAAGTDVRMLVEIVSLWFMSNNFGALCVIHQVLASPRNQFDEFAFDDETNDMDVTTCVL